MGSVIIMNSLLYAVISECSAAGLLPPAEIEVLVVDTVVINITDLSAIKVGVSGRRVGDLPSFL